MCRLWHLRLFHKPPLCHNCCINAWRRGWRFQKSLNKHAGNSNTLAKHRREIEQKNTGTNTQANEVTQLNVMANQMTNTGREMVQNQTKWTETVTSCSLVFSVRINMWIWDSVCSSDWYRVQKVFQNFWHTFECIQCILLSCLCYTPPVNQRPLISSVEWPYASFSHLWLSQRGWYTHL